ncbi:MAG: hypothetical protein V4510_00635 [bacterium]
MRLLLSLSLFLLVAGVLAGCSTASQDTDGDGLSDSREAEVGTDPNKEDTDEDGLTDAAEVNEDHTNATAPDTDHDGVLDGAEIAAHSNPLVFDPPAFGFGNLTVVDKTYGPSEPSILVDPAGTVWIAGPTGFVTPATNADPVPYTHDSGLWSSKDAGKTWAFNARVPGYGRDACPGGGDSDIAASPDGALYLIDLWLGNVPIDVSTDGGNTWLFNCYTSVAPGTDRQWVAATNDYVWISVNHLGLGAEVYRADKLGLPTDGLVFGPPTLVPDGGVIVVDQKDGTLYLAGSGETMYVSTDHGATFKAHQTGLQGTDLSGGFRTIALDAQGNVFVAGSGDAGFVVSGSKDKGNTWTEAATFAPYAKGDYAFPWMTAGGNGTVDFAWYGRPDPAPAGGKGYYVYAGQSTNVLELGANATASIVQVTPKPVLTIDICMGLGCGPGRALGDFFEVGVDLEGHMVIAYDDANGNDPPALMFAKQSTGVLAPPQKP